MNKILNIGRYLFPLSFLLYVGLNFGQPQVGASICANLTNGGFCKIECSQFFKLYDTTIRHFLEPQRDVLTILTVTLIFEFQW